MSVTASSTVKASTATVQEAVLLKVQKLRQKKKERRKVKKAGVQVCVPERVISAVSIPP